MTLLAQQNPPVLRTSSLDEGRKLSNSCSPSSRGAVERSETEGFRSWLTSKNYSSSTIRNYLSDINAYFDFINPLKQNSCSPSSRGAVERSETEGFSPETISAYLKTIQKDSNYSRYLSSLSKYFQFALDQGLISTNPLKAALRDKKPSSDEIINQYSEYLNKKNFSSSTIKNYLNDIRQFIDWSKSTPNPSFDERRGISHFSKFKFLIPLLHRHAVVPQLRDEGWSKGKAAQPKEI